ncbi:unnamed protein product [Rhizophagus irregularis]|uniref:Crinkler effector protein N-terminal domain-containing protein n=1 Tax=Rhizophagus irregularis TaxID=588596 RepID=A0A915YS82_9GLOM|nr:unnamed protein product [Rhizophagus irregularis]CAB5322100.1 unnamed protein product [Rhizophagus irregularis]
MFTVGTSIRLWCLIGRDNFIIDLKEIIKNRKQNKFAKVDFDQLILWKVNIDQSQIKTTSINDILNDEDKLENSGLTVVKTFPNTKGNNVKVIIGVPALVVEEKAIYYQYNQSKVIPIKNSIWNDFVKLFESLQKLFDPIGSMIDYNFIIANKRVKFDSKEVFVKFIDKYQIRLEILL